MFEESIKKLEVNYCLKKLCTLVYTNIWLAVQSSRRMFSGYFYISTEPSVPNMTSFSSYIHQPYQMYNYGYDGYINQLISPSDGSVEVISKKATRVKVIC